MPALASFAKDIWTASAPHSFIGLHVGTRMTVLRLSSGMLLLHSPVPLEGRLRSEIDALGEVAHIVCPNLFHHTYAAEAATAYPRALLHGPAALQRKRKDLRFGAVLTDTPHPEWRGDLELLTIEGCMLRETVFYHPTTRTLIACDLVENFRRSPHWLTRNYLRMGGILGHVGWHPLLRVVYRDRQVARACVDKLLEWPFERVALAHGDPLTDNAHDSVRQGMAWL
ncbi:DUF4336 domain-containing protein [Burkholderia mayonis]|uniref:DUF4336 domain-containing protein n=1 Tax=Burkholderia mayonis TaxID=1385591 RepID=A0A1B4G2C0_9BURK|nr:DUF4336 domain-containing protein [Burkholderia mayonis]AOJ10077.1 hypothetical protein WS71_22815 [Burkholderia mayonis]KVE51495.1 hypothetical protein WS71_12515 [Burkholderia mayonis]